jgi:putative heme-binding domain-containing protein
VFTQVCGACHQYEGKDGKMFGPDISTVRNREKASVMLDILDPNRSIAVKYDLWTVSGKDGSRWTGILQAETPAAITLMQAGGQPITISRSTIKDMATSGVSAMPVGLESSLTKEQMGHLLAFITGKNE